MPTGDTHNNDPAQDRQHRSAIIVSASSDIGFAMSLRWRKEGWRVCGTYRTDSAAVSDLGRAGVELIACDLTHPASVRDGCARLRSASPAWDVLVLCPGTIEPVGPFKDCPFDSWEESLIVNFTSQLRMVHELLPTRRPSSLGPLVLFFAGGGANSAPVNYSAYTISKIALTKMCELLDAEVPDTRFTILGPGLVKTKIHQATLKAGARSGANYQRTLEKLAGSDCTPMEQVLDCCDWLVGSRRDVIGGRNFSVTHDRWGSDELKKRLIEEPDMYKLRRRGNEVLVK